MTPNYSANQTIFEVKRKISSMMNKMYFFPLGDNDLDGEI